MDDIAKKGLEEARKALEELKKFLFNTAVTAGGVVIGVLWVDAIKSALEKYMDTANTPLAKLCLAVVITVIFGLFTLYVSRKAGAAPKDKDVAKPEQPKKDDC